MVDGFDGGFAAEAAARAGEDVAGEVIEIDADVRRYENVEDIAEDSVFAREAVGDFHDVLALVEEAFGEEETAGEFLVVAGGAHRDGDAAALDADFERFLAGDPVVLRRGRGVDPVADHVGLSDGVGGDQGFLRSMRSTLP